MKFCDEVNSYVKDEHGTPTRKALMIGGISMEFKEIEEEYTEIMEEIQAKADSDATTALYRNAGLPVPAAQPETPNTENPNEPEVLNLSDTIYSLSTTITFYSVEHMQDPTEQLDQQDNTVVL